MTTGDSQSIFDGADRAVTVYVAGPDGAIIDVIDDVDLGEHRSARERGRVSLYEACQWAAYVTHRYEERYGYRRPGRELIEIPVREGRIR